MMGLNNQRDAATDARAGKWTLASVWGVEIARICNLFCLVMTVLLPTVYLAIFELSPRIMLVWVPFMAFGAHWLRLLRGASGRQLIPILGATGKYFLCYHLCLAIGVLL